jgi:hypothetical protein
MQKKVLFHVWIALLLLLLLLLLLPPIHHFMYILGNALHWCRRGGSGGST